MRDGGARGVVAGAGDVLAAQLALGEHRERKAMPAERGRVCSARPPGTRRTSGPAASSVAEIAGICRSFARCGTTAGWNIAPERLVSRCPHQADAPARRSRGGHVPDDVDAGLGAERIGHRREAQVALERARRSRCRARARSPARRAAAAPERWSSPPASEAPNSRRTAWRTSCSRGTPRCAPPPRARAARRRAIRRRRASRRPSTAAAGRCRSRAGGSRRAPPASAGCARAQRGSVRRACVPRSRLYPARNRTGLRPATEHKKAGRPTGDPLMK